MCAVMRGTTIRTWLWGLACLLLVGAAPAGAGTYVSSSGASVTAAYPSRTLSAPTQLFLADAQDDAVSANAPIGFTFNFSGTAYTTFRVSTNGLVFLGAAPTTSAFGNTALPAAGLGPVLLPFWDDLFKNKNTSFVEYQTLGAAPARVLVVQYRAMGFFSDRALLVNFQVQLWESGEVVYSYGSMANSGNGATVGIQVSTSDCEQYSLNTAAVPTGTTILYQRLSSVVSCGPRAVGPHHLEIQGSASGVTCAANLLTIRACADASCATPYTGGVTGTLSAVGTPTVVWTDGSPNFSIAPGSSSVTESVAVTTAGTVVFGTSAIAPVASNPTSCNFGAPACTFTSANAGFIIAVAANGAGTSLPTQTAGTTSANFVLRAVQTSTTTAACTAALSGPNTVSWAYQCNNPTTCSSGNRLTVTGSGAVAFAGNPNGSFATSTAVPMTFDANGNAPFSIHFADVGQITLQASKAAGGALQAPLSGVSNAFVAKPAGFVLSNIRCANYVAGACATTAIAAPGNNPAAASAAGAAFMAAGQPIAATLTAVGSTGLATPNFGRETVPEGVALTRNLILPVGGAAGTLANATIAGGNFAAGVATLGAANNLSWSEVGIITLTPSVADADYLGTGNVTGTTSGNIGRFIPASFALGATSVTHRVASAGCAASTFTYLDEGFRLAIGLTARNTAGATTQNYGGSFAKLDPTVASAWNLAGISGSTVLATGVGGRLLSGTATGAWSNGVVSAALGATVLRAAAPDAPLAASFGIAPADSDGVALSPNNLDTDNNGLADRVSLGVTVPLRYGRLRLQNAYGSERLPLPLALQAQFWNGSAFVVNGLDTCTSIAANQFAFAFPAGSASRPNNLAACETAITVGGAAPDFAVSLAAPGLANSGWADITLNLGVTASGNACTSVGAAGPLASTANLPGLQYNWTGTVGNPVARAFFGLFKSPLIYQRENY